MLVVVENEVQIQLLVHRDQRIQTIIITVGSLEHEFPLGRRFHGILENQLLIVMDHQINQCVLGIFDVENQLFLIIIYRFYRF